MAIVDESVVRVARRLGDLREQVAFLGGAVLGLLLDAPAAGGIRPTDDVDVVIDIASQHDRMELDQTLRRLGFRPDATPSAPICRWKLDGVSVDIMPTAPDILGFANRWYPAALETAAPYELAPGLVIRVVRAPCFIATKLEAFRGRGNGDYMASHDLEDVIAVVDGRDALIDETCAAPTDVRDYLAATFRELLATSEFVEAIAGHVVGDDARARAVMQRLKMIAANG